MTRRADPDACQGAFAAHAKLSAVEDAAMRRGHSRHVEAGTWLPRDRRSNWSWQRTHEPRQLGHGRQGSNGSEDGVRSHWLGHSVVTVQPEDGHKTKWARPLRRIGALWTYFTYTIGHFCNKTAHSKGFG